MTDPSAPGRPPAPGQWKPADTDRQQVADRLMHAVDEGRLDLNEYDQRLRASEAAQTLQDLDKVVEDLPFPPEEVLTRIGELAVTANTVQTPAGPIPVRGSQWTVQDQWLADQKTPTWAVALAVALIFCIGPFSLLFLRKKETFFHGHMRMTITNGARQYVAYVPVHSRPQIQYLHEQVEYVRTLAAR